MTTVDVVIPCYNYGRYLRACVQSVLSQSGVRTRVLIIDDASSDQTSQVAQEIVATNSGVEFIRHEVNKGHIATYNEGLVGWSTAPYVVLLSADDMLAPGSLIRAVGVMEADREVGMVYGPAIHFRSEAELPEANASSFSHTLFRGLDWLNIRCRAGHNVITSPEVVVRGSIQRAVGGYRPELPHTGDLEMWLRIAAVCNIAYIRKVPQAFYRLHAVSMTKARTSFVDLVQRKAAFDALFQHCHVPDAALLHESANRALAREALWDACRAYDRNQVQLCRTDELVEFATETYSRATSLPEYRALLRRKRLGPVFCNRTQLFAPPALIRRVRRELIKRHWKRNGI